MQGGLILLKSPQTTPRPETRLRHVQEASTRSSHALATHRDPVSLAAWSPARARPSEEKDKHVKRSLFLGTVFFSGRHRHLATVMCTFLIHFDLLHSSLSSSCLTPKSPSFVAGCRDCISILEGVSIMAAIAQLIRQVDQPLLSFFLSFFLPS